VFSSDDQLQCDGIEVLNETLVSSFIYSINPEIGEMCYSILWLSELTIVNTPHWDSP